MVSVWDYQSYTATAVVTYQQYSLSVCKSLQRNSLQALTETLRPMLMLIILQALFHVFRIVLANTLKLKLYVEPVLFSYVTGIAAVVLEKGLNSELRFR